MPSNQPIDLYMCHVTHTSGNVSNISTIALITQEHSMWKCLHCRSPLSLILFPVACFLPTPCVHGTFPLTKSTSRTLWMGQITTRVHISFELFSKQAFISLWIKSWRTVGRSGLFAKSCNKNWNHFEVPSKRITKGHTHIKYNHDRIGCFTSLHADEDDELQSAKWGLIDELMEESALDCFYRVGYELCCGSRWKRPGNQPEHRLDCISLKP